MKILNKTKNNVLCENCGLADSFLARFRGLMMSDRKNLVIKATKQGILESSIHMMFMRYPLDVVWADNDGKVVDIQRIRAFNIFHPSTWRTYKPKNPARYVIELGNIKKIEVDTDDVLEFETTTPINNEKTSTDKDNPEQKK